MRDKLVTWRQMIEAELKDYAGEQIIAITPNEALLDVEFDSGYGSPAGETFTAWTQNRVLFPVCYDGAEWVGSVPRNPSDEATAHIGGY